MPKTTSDRSVQLRCPMRISRPFARDSLLSMVPVSFCVLSITLEEEASTVDVAAVLSISAASAFRSLCSPSVTSALLASALPAPEVPLSLADCTLSHDVAPINCSLSFALDSSRRAFASTIALRTRPLTWANWTLCFCSFASRDPRTLSLSCSSAHTRARSRHSSRVSWTFLT
eukprot:CAMPEP_0169482234 /NCGR_PEP_ID=MMETSP1042-20121227/30569_1 /TAXON_ID=464988 /ORGANISM="Hemiselmis andersenii, Strain CCMP1180" /LENGTH=172 /DNA_ID=CAMNT_0009597093 /DNA_START=58 /DNA_END=576 /DNA_ORIENTATION=+